MITLKNGSYLSPETDEYITANLQIEGELIESFTDEEKGTVYDVEGCRILPGLIDIHTHGGIGYDTMKASPTEIAKWSRFLAKNGVTSFMPTTITASKEEILKSLKNVKIASQLPEIGATIIGAHIEGPYLNANYRGAHDASLIVPTSIDDAKDFKNILGDELIIRYTVAPEIDGAMEFIRFVVSNGGFISIGHCDATFEMACTAVENGANSFTHTFNAMRGLHHREPGTVGAAFLTTAYAEAICDGLHLHPEIVRLICNAKGTDKLVAITDAMQATGLGDGVYPFAGNDVHVVNGAARTPEGNLAGSTLLLKNAVTNISEFGKIAFEKALSTATINPAKAVGIYDITGSISVGKRADFVVVDKNMNIRYTFCRGKKVFDLFTQI